MLLKNWVSKQKISFLQFYNSTLCILYKQTYISNEMYPTSVMLQNVKNTARNQFSFHKIVSWI